MTGKAYFTLDSNSFISAAVELRTDQNHFSRVKLFGAHKGSKKGSTHTDTDQTAMQEWVGRDSSRSALQAPCATGACDTKYIHSAADAGVTAGVLGNTDVCLVAYGCLVETRVIVTNAPKGPTL